MGKEIAAVNEKETEEDKLKLENEESGGGNGEITNECVLEIWCHCPVSVLTIDHENNVLLAGLDNVIHIYDVENSGKLLQVRHGHAENIRCILSVPERKQYISGS